MTKTLFKTGRKFGVDPEYVDAKGARYREVYRGSILGSSIAHCDRRGNLFGNSVHLPPNFFKIV